MLTSKTIKKDIPSFLMTPHKLGDLYADDSSRQSAINGLVRIAPVQTERWWLEPAYHNVVPTYADLHEVDYYNRYKMPYVEHGISLKVTQQLEEVYQSDSWPSEGRFLHLLRTFIGSQSTGFTEACVIIVDVLIPNLTYESRRTLLECHFKELGIKDKATYDQAFLVPRFQEKESRELWSCLHLQNQAWDADVYGGIVMKCGQSKYYFQQEEQKLPNVLWLNHKFVSFR